MPSLILDLGATLCAIPALHVEETMRPLPVEPVKGMPPFLLGISVVRGLPVPVLHLSAFLGIGRAPEITRFVALKLGHRRVVLAVRGVIGIRELEGRFAARLPPLVRAAAPEAIEAMGILDAQLLVDLRGSHLLSEEVWTALSTEGPRP